MSSTGEGANGAAEVARGEAGSNACSQAVIANFDVCNGMADMTSQMHPAESLHLTEQLEAIVTGCTAWKNGGHYDLDAITGGTR